jgi:hypothetical protein
MSERMITISKKNLSEVSNPQISNIFLQNAKYIHEVE